MKTIKGKLAQKLFACLVLLLAACMLYTGCGVSIEKNDPTKDLGCVRAITVYERFENHDTASFVKFKINNIYDDEYQKYGSKYLFVEGVVLEDYYGKMDKGAVVTIPLLLSYKPSSDSRNLRVYDKDEFVKFLQEYDCFYIYIVNGRNHSEYYSLNNQRYEEFDSLTCVWALSDYCIIPVKDGEIKIGHVYDILEKYDVVRLEPQDILYFEDLIKDGQDEADFVESIKRIYEYTKVE